jgi:hypothetical protein
MRNFGDGFADDEVEKLGADIVAFCAGTSA